MCSLNEAFFGMIRFETLEFDYLVRTTEIYEFDATYTEQNLDQSL